MTPKEMMTILILIFGKERSFWRASTMRSSLVQTGRALSWSSTLMSGEVFLIMSLRLLLPCRQQTKRLMRLRTSHRTAYEAFGCLPRRFSVVAKGLREQRTVRPYLGPQAY